MVLLSLIFSDFAAVRHAGGCCRDVSAELTLGTGCSANPSDSAVASRCCQRGCERDNPFRRGLGTGPGDAAKVDKPAETAGESLPAMPDDGHDRDRCSVCRWLAVFSGGIQLAAPVAIEHQRWATVVDVAVIGISGKMIFLPTVSRRGPPVFA